MDRTVNVEFHTFGCKVNTYDTGLMQKKLVSTESNKQVHVVNTCAVTQEATQQAVALVKKLKKQHPESHVVVTGCAAQVDAGYFEPLHEVDLIVANSHKHQLKEIIEQAIASKDTPKLFRSNIFKKEDLGQGGGLEKEHTRSFFKIQDGCNSFCTFCIIPYARGLSRSLSVTEIVAGIGLLEKNNVAEVVLTGVHIGDYFDDSTGSKLENLIEKILESTSTIRIRLGSLEPIELNNQLLTLFENSRLCQHFHLSIQSANSRVLRDMKRHYTTADIVNSLTTLNQRFPMAFVGMDVIAGFPTETDAEFEDTYTTLASVPWTRLHVFPYSERSGTVAATMDPVALDIRKKRAKKLRDLSWSRVIEKAKLQIGTVKRGLVLSQGKALSDDYWTIEIENIDKSVLSGWSGELVTLKITDTVPRQIQQEVWLKAEWVENE